MHECVSRNSNFTSFADLPAESILDARKGILAAMIKECQKLVTRYESSTNEGPMCTYTTKDREACDALTLGSLIKGLIKAQLWPLPSEPSKIERSVANLREILLNLQCFTYVSSYPYNPHSCTFKPHLAKELQDILLRLKDSGVLGLHRRRMEEQHKRLDF